MSSRFFYYFKIVAAVHVGVVLVVMTVSSWRSCRREKRDIVMPVGLIVEAAPVEDLNESEMVSEPEPDPIAPAPPKPKPKPKPKRKPIERSKERVTRPKAPGERRLSKEELERMKRLLAQGAKPSTKTIVPGDEARCLAIVKRLLYDAWSQPSREEVGTALTEALIEIAKDGRITGWRLARKSGNAMMDASVKQALSEVRRIDGLSSSFLRSRRELTIAFRLE